MRFLDIPRVWLSWLQPLFIGAELRFGFETVKQVGAPLVGNWVDIEWSCRICVYRKRTTIAPHMNPSALIKNGIFSRSRNPIYLVDALILTGLILRWDAVLSVILVPAFM